MRREMKWKGTRRQIAKTGDETSNEAVDCKDCVEVRPAMRQQTAKTGGETSNEATDCKDWIRDQQ